MPDDQNEIIQTDLIELMNNRLTEVEFSGKNFYKFSLCLLSVHMFDCIS